MHRSFFAVLFLACPMFGLAAMRDIGSQAQAQTADFEENSVTVDGIARDYGIHIPTNVPNPAPVVFLFHGGGGRPQSIARRTGMSESADKNGFIAIYPAGVGREGRRGTWNVGVGPGQADDVGFVRAILADVEKHVPIDPKRIYATGLSMGGVFSYRLACEMSDTFAAVAPVAATMVERSCKPDSPVAGLQIHGSDDDHIPLQGGHGSMTAGDRSWPAPQKGAMSWSALDGCSGEPTRATDGPMDCTSYSSCRAPVQFCVIPHGGHTWPEGGTDRIWAFFAAHPK